MGDGPVTSPPAPLRRRKGASDAHVASDAASTTSTEEPAPLPSAAGTNHQLLTTNYSALTPWAEVRVKTDEHLPNLRQTLLDVLSEVTDADGSAPLVELVRISQERRTSAPASAPKERKQLDELDPEEVFSGIVTKGGYPPERARELLADFRNLRNWMNDTDA